VRRAVCVAVSLLATCLLGGCQGDHEVLPARPPDASTAEPPLLREVTAESGLAERPAPWPEGTFFVPEIMGPGVGLLDYDGDGDLDLLERRTPPPGRRSEPARDRLLERQSDGTLVDVSLRSGLQDPGFGQGLAVGDADNDGDLDVYLANVGADAFYRNDGDGTFGDATREAGFSGERWSTAAAFCDYDRDGWLDLFVAHYLRLDHEGPCRTDSGVDDYCGPGSFDGVAAILYRNAGDGTFQDVTTAAKLLPPEGGRRAKGLGAVCLDLTADGWADLYAANDGEANHLWVSQRDGTFAEEGVMRGVALNLHGKPEASMGLAVGDVDGDGYLDLLSTHLTGESNTLYRGGPVVFMDRTAESGMTAHDLNRTGFGAALFDLEHDGDLDLAVVNGDVRIDSAQASLPFWERYAEPNLLFVNDGRGRFENWSHRAGRFGSLVETSRGLALGDLDGDGDQDLVTSQVDNTTRIFLNDAPARGAHWLQVRALTRDRDALGAIVALAAAGRRWLAPLVSHSSYQSSHDPRVHFGLGDAHGVVEATVTWPDGAHERFVMPAVDRHVVLRQGAGERP
jgi:hypothetical protein